MHGAWWGDRRCCRRRLLPAALLLRGGRLPLLLHLSGCDDYTWGRAAGRGAAAEYARDGRAEGAVMPFWAAQGVCSSFPFCFFFPPPLLLPPPPCSHSAASSQTPFLLPTTVAATIDSHHLRFCLGCCAVRTPPPRRLAGAGCVRLTDKHFSKISRKKFIRLGGPIAPPLRAARSGARNTKHTSEGRPPAWLGPSHGVSARRRTPRRSRGCHLTSCTTLRSAGGSRRWFRRTFPAAWCVCGPCRSLGVPGGRAATCPAESSVSLLGAGSHRALAPRRL